MVRAGAAGEAGFAVLVDGGAAALKEDVADGGTLNVLDDDVLDDVELADDAPPDETETGLVDATGFADALDLVDATGLLDELGAALAVEVAEFAASTVCCSAPILR